MGTRSQSDVIGVVLLTVIVSLTVTATGAVTLTEWQNDLGGDPVTDIESELAVDRVELEHFGGDELNASETVVLLDGKRTIPLEEFDGVGDQFVGGMQISNDEFEPLAGDVSLRVVHEPSQSVVHSETFGLEFLLLVEGETGPVFMYEEPSINYTLSDDAELTVSDATVIDLDEDDSTITGTRTGETTLTADDGEETQTIDLSVIEPDELGITTVETNALGSDRIELTSELTELGALDETELFIRYRQQRPVEFNGKPDDNGDEVIAHGEFYEDPDGYTHGDRWVHDNTRLLPGTNRTYEYYAESPVSEIVATLRSEPETEETVNSEEFAIDEIGDFDFIRDDNNVPVDEPFEITVEYTDDGEEVRVYVEGQHEWTWDNTNNIGDYDELYFSTREGGNTLRLISSPTIGEPKYDRVDSGVTSPTVDTSVLRGLQPDTVYFVEAHTEREITNGIVNATGETIAVQTEKLVETREPTAVSAESVRLQGELLESFGETDLSFVVERPNGTEIRNTTVATDLDSPRTFSTTVEGLDPNSSYVYYARAVESGGAAPKITGTGQDVSVTTDETEIETLDRRATGPSSIEVDGELTNIAGLDEMNLFVRYRQQQPVEFNGKPDDNGDEVIAHGEFTEDEDPDGYTHDGRWVHDNTRLLPGTNRTYEYYAESQVSEIVATLRSEPETKETFESEEFAIEGIGDFDFIRDDNNIPVGEPFEITVEYTDDGEEVRVYVEGQHEWTWDNANNIGDYDELYFSTREGGNTLRLVSSPTIGSERTEFVDTTDSATSFTGSVSGLQPDTAYFVEAYAEREINGQTINTTGETVAIQTEKLVETREPTAVGAESVRLEGELLESLGETDLSFVVETPDGTEVANTTAATGLDSSRTFSTTVHGLEPNSSYVYYARAVESGGAAPKITGTGQEIPFTTDEPEIVTLDRRATGPNSIEVDGELTNIAELDEMDLSVRYRTQRSVGFTSDPEEDELVGAGGFQTDPAGYAHDTWVHDNTPLYPGTNRTYEYLAGSDTAVIVGALRDEPTDDTSDSNAIDEIGDWDDFIQDSDKIPRGEPFEITVEYTDDGEEVRVYVAGELNQTWDSSENIGDYDELYFTTGDSGEPPEGLRVVSAPTFSEPQFEFAETATTAPTPFTAEISGLEAGTVYAVEVYAERTVNNQTITATGETLAVDTAE
ncbi:MAG: hypothetical protein U9O06_03275 [Euryarchaeota archaeon]|nr:hypothetical protein [Euryarchaeota archaeon]